MADRWFIARNKQKLGPYLTQDMKAMASAGQLLPSDIVLQDGSTHWMTASQVQQFFPTAESALPCPPLPPPIPHELAEWHFTQNGQQAGPATWTQLKRRADSSQLQPTDMVWKNGMAAWVAASTMNGLFPPQNIAPPPLPSLAGPVEAAKITESEAHFDRGSKCVKEGSYERAILHFTKAIALDPDYAEAYVKRSLCYNKIGEFEKAIADSTEAIRISPNNASYYDGRATDYCDYGDEERAIADSKEALRREPYNQHYVDRLADFYNHFGVQHQKKKDLNKAIMCVTEAIRLRPNDAQHYSNRGNYYVTMDDYPAALSDFEKAVQLDPSNTDARGQLKQLAVAVYYNRGIKQYNLKNYKDALADFEKAVQIDPTDSDFQNMLQQTRSKLGMNASSGGGGKSLTSKSSPQVSETAAPSASWPPGAYYCTNGSWNAMPATEDELAQLVKNKSITLDTLLVGVPDSMTPILMFSTPEEKKWFDSVANPPSGLWKAVKVAGLVAGFAAGSVLKTVARYDAAPRGKALCLKCRCAVEPYATRCPYCQGDPREV